MGDFLTPAELASYLQVPEVDTATANLLITNAEAAVRSYCGWKITTETVTGEAYDGGGDVIFLPTTNLTAVGAVVENGVTLTVDTDYRWFKHGKIVRTSGYWYRGWRTVLVTYTHGYASAAPELSVVKDVVASIVSRRWQNPGGIRSETVGGTAEIYSIPASGIIPAGLLYSEMEALAAFRLMTVA